MVDTHLAAASVGERKPATIFQCTVFVFAYMHALPAAES